MRGLLIGGLAKAAGPAGMVAGQMIDMLGDAKDLTLPTVARMNRLKTGALICFAVEAGALIGCADDEAGLQVLDENASGDNNLDEAAEDASIIRFVNQVLKGRRSTRIHPREK